MLHVPQSRTGNAANIIETLEQAINKDIRTKASDLSASTDQPQRERCDSCHLKKYEKHVVKIRRMKEMEEQRNSIFPIYVLDILSCRHLPSP
ncbi:hypothetical protein AAMO2058_000792500 [Amorphochlora amoebiformis]